MSCRKTHIKFIYCNSFLHNIFIRNSTENKYVEILPQGVFTSNKKQQTILQDNLSV